MPDDRLPLVPGTLEMLVLKTLSLEPMHGWGIGERIQQLSREAFHVNQGTLYPVLERLQQRGWVTAEWRASESNRRAKYYILTRTGAKRLDEELRLWERSARAIQFILRTTG
jgi:PadR family transcriptional regulator, regulatory protein PadR